MVTIILVTYTNSTKNRCQIEIVGDSLEIKTIDLLNNNSSKVEKPKDTKEKKQTKIDKIEEEKEVKEEDSDEEDKIEEKDEEEEESKEEKSEDKPTKSKKSRKRKAEDNDEDYNENESDNDDSRKYTKKVAKTKAKPRKKPTKKVEKKAQTNPTSSIKFPPGPNPLFNQQLILSILQNRQLNPLLPRLPGIPGLPGIGNPFMNQPGINNPQFLNPLLQPTNELAKSLNSQNNTLVNHNTNSKNPPAASQPSCANTSTNQLPTIDPNNPFLSMLQNQMNKIAQNDQAKTNTTQNIQPIQLPNLQPVQQPAQIPSQPPSQAPNQTPAPGAQPSLNPVDPVMVAQNYLQNVMKKHSDIQQRIQEMNLLRKDMLQKSLSSMYAATNLYFLMSKSNWQFKPPIRSLAMCLFINQFCSCPQDSTQQPPPNSEK